MLFLNYKGSFRSCILKECGYFSQTASDYQQVTISGPSETQISCECKALNNIDLDEGNSKTNSKKKSLNS